MKCETLVGSKSSVFDQLTAVADAWIPAANGASDVSDNNNYNNNGVWVGDYPYVDKSTFQRLVASMSPSSPNEINNRNVRNVEMRENLYKTTSKTKEIRQSKLPLDRR